METLFKKIRNDHFDKLRSVILNNERYHLESDTWTHTCLVFSKAKDDFNKIVSLLHDLGKPLAKEHIDGKDYYRGHEGISTFEALKYIDDIERILGKDKILDVLYTINYHGMLWQKSDRQIKHYFVNDIDKYNKIYDFSLYDQAGNIFFDDEKNRKNKERLLEEDFNKKSNRISNNVKTKEYKNKCYFMIGLPLSGKSTYIKNNMKNLQVLSRDDILMEYVKEKFTCNSCNGKGYIEGWVGDNIDHSICPTCKGECHPNYSDGWKLLSDEDQKEIDKRLREKFNELRNLDEDFVIDMTNLSWKARRRWLTQLKKHTPIAKTFLVDFETLLKRNERRYDEEGKIIPESVLYNMAKRLELPLSSEFNEIEIITNNTKIQHKNKGELK